MIDKPTFGLMNLLVKN